MEGDLLPFWQGKNKRKESTSVITSKKRMSSKYKKQDLKEELSLHCLKIVKDNFK